jgi:hypothetical protein
MWHLTIGPFVTHFSQIRQPMWYLIIRLFVIHFNQIKHSCGTLLQGQLLIIFGKIINIRPFVDHFSQIIYGMWHLGIKPCHSKHAMWHLAIGWNINHFSHNKHAIWQTCQLGISSSQSQQTIGTLVTIDT